MTGAIALVGSGEFTPALESIDRELLAATGRTRPRVAVLLATAGAPHSNDGPERRGELGYQHFRTLGAEVEVLVLRSRDAADDPAPAQAVGEADLVYLVGNRSTEICPLLADSPVLAALRRGHDRGAVVVGSGAAAVALGELHLQLRRRPRAVHWGPALGLVPGAIVIAAYDARPEAWRAFQLLRAPGGHLAIGIDARTAFLGRGGIWQVQGSGRVTVWRGRRRTRHADGDLIRLTER